MEHVLASGRSGAVEVISHTNIQESSLSESNCMCDVLVLSAPRKCVLLLVQVLHRHRTY